MGDLIQEAVRFYNLPITVCFGLVVAYWLMTIIGVLDTDALEPDLDLDLDAEGGSDVGTSAFGVGIARFLNLGDVPLVVVLSVIISLTWAGTLLGNYYFNSGGSYALALGVLSASGFVSLLLAKVVTTPLKPLMRALKAGEKHRPVVGRECVIKTSEVTSDFGQAEAENDSGNPLLIHVRISEGQEPLKKGARALVVDRLDDAQTYLVRKL